MIGEPLGPSGSGYFDFKPCEYSLAVSNITTAPPKTAKPQLPFWSRRASANDFMMFVVLISFSD
jgi:hypothetical protein